MRRSSLPLGLLFVSAVVATGCGPIGDIQPSPGPDVVIADHPPPAISGGTLLVTRDRSKAIAADPDRDDVYIVDLANAHVATIALDRDDEPGRVVEDGAGRVHVALRRGGAIVTIDLATKQIVARRPVCGAPRGIAYDAATDVLHVACATGELVTLPTVGTKVLRSLRVGQDLRDVIVEGDHLLVSVFRAAKLLTIDAAGQITATRELPHFTPTVSTSEYEAAVAWRVVPMPTATTYSAVMVHQRGLKSSIPLNTGASYYSNAGCDGSIVHAAVSFFQAEQTTTTTAEPAPALPVTALPVDVAVSPSGARVAVAAAGSQTLVTANVADLTGSSTYSYDNCNPSITSTPVDGQPTSVAYQNDTTVVVQTREPAQLVIVADDGSRTIALSDESVADSGHDVFHLPPRQLTGMTCAGCHPEGRDDGRVWNFDPIGPRRTQSISGGIMDTAPFHWDGDLPDMGSLMTEVFTTRMGGQPVGAHRVRAFKLWLDQAPRLPVAPSLDEEAIARGEALFNDPTVGCTGCHSGEHFTNNKNTNVGTSGNFQVPSLVGVGARAPYMHDGCAKTLAARFTDPTCGGGDQHGRTSQLSDAQLGDLVVYLESL